MRLLRSIFFTLTKICAFSLTGSVALCFIGIVEGCFFGALYGLLFGVLGHNNNPGLSLAGSLFSGGLFGTCIGAAIGAIIGTIVFALLKVYMLVRNDREVNVMIGESTDGATLASFWCACAGALSGACFISILSALPGDYFNHGYHIKSSHGYQETICLGFFYGSIIGFTLGLALGAWFGGKTIKVWYGNLLDSIRNPFFVR